MSLKQFVPMIVVMALQKADLETMGVVPHIRILFGCVMTCLILVGLHIMNKIKNMEGGDGMVKVKAQVQFGSEVAPAYQCTVKEYDERKAMDLMKQVVIGAGICSVIHYKWEYVIPLAMQCIMTPMTVFDNQLFKLHVMNCEAVGDYSRPFPEPKGPFSMDPPANEEQREEQRKADQELAEKQLAELAEEAKNAPKAEKVEDKKEK